MFCHPVLDSFDVVPFGGLWEVSGRPHEVDGSESNYVTSVNFGGALTAYSSPVSVAPDGTFDAFLSVPGSVWGTVSAQATDNHGRESNTLLDIVPPTPLRSLSAVGPQTQSTTEGVPIAFSAATGNPLTVMDTSDNNAQVQVSLSAANGTISLATIGGITLTQGIGSNDSDEVLSGSVADVNAALNGATFTPAPGFSGQASLQFGVALQSDDSSDGQQTQSTTVAITVWHVDQPPVNTLPATQSVDEGATLTLSTQDGNSIAVADSDAGNSNERVTLEATHGTLSLGQTAGLTIQSGTGINDAKVQFTGTIAQLDAALDGLTFSPAANFVGNASLKITTDNFRITQGIGGPQSARRLLSVFK